MISLFSPAESGLRRVSEYWYVTRDCDREASALYRRHYSCQNAAPKHSGFIGPGEKIVLISAEASALFVWRREKVRRDGQTGINCTVFRNESSILSSDLICEAMTVAWDRWPGQRLFTFVNPRAIKSRNPGYCFLMAGWRRCGVTKENALLILEYL